MLREKPVRWALGRGGLLFERAAASTEAWPLGLELCPKWSANVDEHPRKQGPGGGVRALDADARQTLATAWFFLRFTGRWWEKRHRRGPGGLAGASDSATSAGSSRISSCLT
ncbi:hypothetical protein WME91_39465 [Sorangium sp. So ce269]